MWLGNLFCWGSRPQDEASDDNSQPSTNLESSSNLTPQQLLPDEILGEKIGQFLDRQTLDHLALTNRPIRHIIQTSTLITKPWPSSTTLELSAPGRLPVGMSRQECKCLCFSPDGQTLACGDGQGMLHIWRSDDGRRITLGQQSTIHCISFHPSDSDLLLTPDNDNINLWKLSTFQVLLQLQGHDEDVSHVCFHPPDGHLIISSSHDGTVRIWRTCDGACLQILRGGHHSRMIQSPTPYWKVARSRFLNSLGPWS